MGMFDGRRWNSSRHIHIFKKEAIKYKKEWPNCKCKCSSCLVELIEEKDSLFSRKYFETYTCVSCGAEWEVQVNKSIKLEFASEGYAPIEGTKFITKSGYKGEE